MREKEGGRKSEGERGREKEGGRKREGVRKRERERCRIWLLNLFHCF